MVILYLLNVLFPASIDPCGTAHTGFENPLASGDPGTRKIVGWKKVAAKSA